MSAVPGRRRLAGLRGLAAARPWPAWLVVVAAATLVLGLAHHPRRIGPAFSRTGASEPDRARPFGEVPTR